MLRIWLRNYLELSSRIKSSESSISVIPSSRSIAPRDELLLPFFTHVDLLLLSFNSCFYISLGNIYYYYYHYQIPAVPVVLKCTEFSIKLMTPIELCRLLAGGGLQKAKKKTIKEFEEYKLMDN